MLSDYQEKIHDYISKQAPIYQDLALDIHAHPEVSNYEFHSQQVLADQLDQLGFKVVRDVAGHRTAFAAYYDSGQPGPTIAFLAEYDALPGIGHACGHNLFGNYSCLAGAAIKQVIDDLGGQVRVYGTPGEEGGENGSAKGSFVRHGFFADVDFALCAHPGHKYQPTSAFLANDPVDIEFFGKSSHAAAAPEKGISALDAMILAFNGINSLRFSMPKDVNIHGVITDGGQAANVVPDYTSARFYLRAKNRATLDQVYQKVENVVAGAAQATGTTYQFGLFQNACDDMIKTPSFDQVFLNHIKALDIPDCDIEENPVDKGLGSSDVGNVSQVIPTIQPYISISDDYIAGHSSEFKAAAKSDKGLASIALAAELLARTALDLYTDDNLRQKIKTDYQTSRAKGN
ncbi:amidohydrolase [Aerococcus urinaehominis]|uniref:Peptidase M20 domain-containing protein 2 n=1 Tax=Aerococcus urinaehominis TaxID=128944 RepID=A0A0X8FL34_9LACT|nr:M20 family metallopeptidase [Aerococcus urinaehominis]AMB99285.1 amidohydrolase [Aerococcus urinaehominis]SDM18959.1 amidohydrolase [Aerococcus urinaehominis]